MAEDLTWVDITDYTPGIRNTPSPGHPPGSATQEGTYGCHSNEDKGLQPMPKAVTTWSLNPTTQLGGVSAPSSLVSESYRIGGIKCIDPVFTVADTIVGPDQNNTDVWVGIEWWTSGTWHRSIQRLLRHRTTPVWEEIYETSKSQSYDPHSRPKKCYFATGRSNNADPDQVGQIVVGWTYGDQARFFPDDTGGGGTVALPGEAEELVFTDALIGHQGRALIFPLSLVNMQNGVISPTNENFYWSGVNDWRTLDTNLNGLYFNVVAGYENPTGYSVIASNDAGELLLIKARGGAVLIRGDLNNFSAQTLPNVRGAGQALDLGTHTPLGYMYPVDADGIWIWTGGDTTVNASPFMKPDFYRPANADLDDVATGWGYHFTQMESWNNWVMTPNNWFGDTDVLAPEGVPGWWRLEQEDRHNPDDYRFCKYTVDWKGRKMYAAQMGFRGEDDPVLVEYDATVKRPEYSWQGQPLPFTIDPARTSELREVNLCAFGEGTVEVIVTSTENPDGQSQIYTFESDDAGGEERRYVTRQSHAFSVKGSHHQIRYIAKSLDGESAAPSICPPTSLGYKPAQHIPTTR